MIGQTHEQPQTTAPQNATPSNPLAIGEFPAIPTRIQDVPELIVEKADPQIEEEIVENLTNLGQRLGTIHLTAAEAYLSQSRYAEAVPHIEAAVGMDPSDVDNLNQLGYVRYLAGDDKGAILALERVLDIDSVNSDALFNIGMISFGLEDLETAEEAFRACSQQDADNPEVWNNFGVTLFKRGKGAEARTCFQQSLAIDPENEDALYNLQSV